jgi:hypothetical protein
MAELQALFFDLPLDPGTLLWRIWFLVLLFVLAVVFLAKFRFDESHQKREDRRWMLSYSNFKLTPEEEEGKARHIKVTLKGEELKAPPKKSDN